MRIRVLEVIDSAMLGGGQRHVLDLARGLDRARFEVEVCSGPGGPLVEQVAAAGLRHRPLPMPKRPDPRIAWRLRRLLLDGAYDLVHTHGGVAGLWGRVAALGLRKPRRVHTIHGIHYLNYPGLLQRQAMILLERALAGWTDRIICVCRSDLDKALEAGVLSATQARAILNGIDLSAFRQPPPDTRSELGAAAGELVFGTVGRLHVQKGQVHLLEAFAAVLRELPQARLFLIGDGPLAGPLQTRAAELRLGAAVRFLGARQDVPRLLAAMDVFVLPSLWEGLPLTLMEAMAAGRPCVATAVDGNRELLRDRLDGLLVPPADPGALAAALLELGRDAPLRVSLGQAARDRALREFALEPMVHAVEALYAELL